MQDRTFMDVSAILSTADRLRRLSNRPWVHEKHLRWFQFYSSVTYSPSPCIYFEPAACLGAWADQFITSQLTHPILPLSPPLSSHSSLIHHDNWIRRRLGGQAAGEQGDGEGYIQSRWSHVAWEPASAASCSRRTQHPCQERTGQTHQPAADIHTGNEIILHRQFDWLRV